MPNYSYNNNIPAASDIPSQSQSQLQTNCTSVASILSVDLYGFGNNDGGTHQQVTLPNQNAGATQASNSSVIFTGAGIASASTSQLFHQTSLGGASAIPYHVSAVKAWGTFTGASGAIIGAQVSNVGVTVARTGTGAYTVTLPANTVASTNYAVLITCGLASTLNTSNCAAYTIVSTTSFTIRCVSLRAPTSTDDPVSVTFVVLQI